MDSESFYALENQRVNFDELKELHEQDSDGFEQTLNQYTLEVYKQVTQEFRDKCVIKKLSEGDGFVNYVVNVGGQTCYITQVAAGYTAPGEISEGADGNLLSTLNPNNNSDVDAAIVEGLFGKQIEEILNHGDGSRLIVNSNISLRSTQTFGINPREVFSQKEQLELLYSLLRGSQTVFQALNINVEIEDLNNYIINGGNLPISRIEKAAPNTYAGPPGAGKSTSFKIESNYNKISHAYFTQSISDYEIMHRIRDFIRAEISKGNPNEKSVRNFVIKVLVINGFEVTEMGPKLCIFDNLKEKLKIGIASFANDIEMCKATKAIFGEPYTAINSWIRYLAEFIFYGGLDINFEELENQNNSGIFWLPVIERVVYLFLAVFPDNKYKIVTDLFELDDKERSQRPTSYAFREQTSKFYEWLNSFLQKNFPSRLMHETHENLNFDPADFVKNWLQKRSIKDGLPILMKVFNLNWIIQNLRGLEEENWNLIELPEYVFQIKLFFDTLAPEVKVKIISPAEEIIKIIYPGKALVSDFLKDLDKSELFSKIGEFGSELAIFGPTLPLILDYINKNFELIQLCLIMESMFLTVLPSRDNPEIRFEHTNGILGEGTLTT